MQPLFMLWYGRLVQRQFIMEKGTQKNYMEEEDLCRNANLEEGTLIVIWKRGTFNTVSFGYITGNCNR